MSEPKKNKRQQICRRAFRPPGWTMADGARHVGDKDVVLAPQAVSGLRSVHTARTTAGRSPKDSSSATPSGVLASRCFSLRTGEALRAPALDPIALLGVSSARAIRSSSARRCQRPRTAKPSSTRPPRSSSSERGAAGVAAARHDPARRLRRTGHHDQRGRGSAGGSSESVEGLPGRRSEGRMDSAVARRNLRGADASSCSWRRVPSIDPARANRPARRGSRRRSALC